jgi:lipopolysaccharide/colanic/teichoic acid biosynthesis glycosyltransferase
VGTTTDSHAHRATEGLVEDAGRSEDLVRGRLPGGEDPQVGAARGPRFARDGRERLRDSREEGIQVPEGVAGTRTLKRDALYRRSLVAADLVSAAAALLVTLVLLGHQTPAPWLVLAPPLIVLVSKVSGLYDRDENLLRRTTLEEMPALFQLATAYVLLVWAASGVLVSSRLTQGDIVSLWLVLFLLLAVSRAGGRRVVGSLVSIERCLVVGDERSAARLADSLGSTRLVNAEVVGSAPLTGPNAGGNGASHGPDLEKWLEGEVDRVLIAPGHADPEAMLHAVRVAKAAGVKVSVIPRLFDVIGSSVEFDDVDGLLLLGLPRHGLSTSSRRLKRVVDATVAAALLVLVTPLLLIAAAVTRIGFSGPVLVRRRAVGREGDPFEMLCLRSASDPDAAGAGRAAGWRRVASQGGLADLPQLINVLRGEMSLVGPRPMSPGHAPFAGTSNGNGTAVDASLSDLAPGMTGLWRIRGGPESPPDEVVKLDYLYGTNWSPWLDARILLRTIPSLLDPGGTSVPTIGSNGAAAVQAEVATAPLPDTEVDERAVERAFRGLRTVPEAPPTRPPTLSAVVPATNQPATLDACLAAIQRSTDPPEEIIVVNDPAIGGPAAARNAGAARARGDVLVFVDADVVVHRDAFATIRKTFREEQSLGAVFGAYDDGAGELGRVGAFRNLLHHYVHHRCAGPVTTFWSGLGAVRREAFSDSGGFDSRQFDVPSVEDIDLGMRLSERGADIVLDPTIQGTHLKDWSLWDMVRTDFLRRGVPWTVLLLRSQATPRTTLNLSWRHRLSAGATLAVLVGLLARRPALTAGSAMSMFVLNGRFYLLLARRHGVATSVAGVGLHMVHHVVSAAAVPTGVAVHLLDRRSKRLARRSV